jgi:hypothetical protein
MGLIANIWPHLGNIKIFHCGDATLEEHRLSHSRARGWARAWGWSWSWGWNWLTESPRQHWHHLLRRWVVDVGLQVESASALAVGTTKGIVLDTIEVQTESDGSSRKLVVFGFAMGVWASAHHIDLC